MCVYILVFIRRLPLSKWVSPQLIIFGHLIALLFHRYECHQDFCVPIRLWTKLPSLHNLTHFWGMHFARLSPLNSSSSKCSQFLQTLQNILIPAPVFFLPAERPKGPHLPPLGPLVAQISVDTRLSSGPSKSPSCFWAFWEDQQKIIKSNIMDGDDQCLYFRILSQKLSTQIQEAGHNCLLGGEQ